MPPLSFFLLFFFFNDTATTEIYTLSLHDALPISIDIENIAMAHPAVAMAACIGMPQDRKSTRLNSSHSQISYAVFCLKKKKKQTHYQRLYWHRVEHQGDLHVSSAAHRSDA